MPVESHPVTARHDTRFEHAYPVEAPDLRSLYEKAKRDQWNVSRDIDWTQPFDIEQGVLADEMMDIYGTPFWDHPTTRAARRVLITAERLVPTDVLRLQPELTLVPGFMVEAVAIVPNGGWPGSMHPLYEIDYPAVERYMKDEPGALEKHLAEAPENAERREARGVQ